MLVLITTAIDPYHYDIAGLLALPQGQQHRFRYRRQHIASPTAHLATNEPAVVVIREFETGELWTLRAVTIRDVLPHGDLLYFRLEVGQFLNDVDAATVIAAAKSRLAELGERSTAGTHLTNLVVDVEYSHANASEDGAQKWDIAVDRLAKLPCFANFNFIRVLEPSLFTAKKASRIKNSVLRPGHGYLLSVLQRSSKSPSTTEALAEPIGVQLVGEDGVSVVSGKQWIVGPYDVLRFSFRTSQSFGTSRASMIVAGAAAGSRSRLMPELVLEYVVSPTLRARVIAALKGAASLAGILATMYPGAVAEVIAATKWGRPTDDVVRGVALLLVVWSTTGALAEISKAILGDSVKKID